MTVLTNARLVLPDRVMLGTIVIGDGVVTRIDDTIVTDAIDCDGDHVIPGIVDLHTDNLERQVQPRSNARWPSRSAMIAHDQQCAACGVTTVFDALCLGDLGFEKDRNQTFTDGVADLDALAGTGLLKAEHFLHLRCELPAAEMLALFEPVADNPRVRMVSLMDHTPGVGQYFNLAHYRKMRVKEGLADDYIEQRMRELQGQRARYRDANRHALLARLAGHSVVIASHDDRTREEIAENAADGIGISEFPVTLEAAQAAHAHGITVIAGSPNIVRGGSHSGNVAAMDLIRAGVMDALASDYVPASLVEAAFRIAAEQVLPLPAAIALVTSAPAGMARMPDRGRLAEGLRADLARVRLHEGLPVVRQVWRAGERVA